MTKFDRDELWQETERVHVSKLKVPGCPSPPSPPAGKTPASSTPAATNDWSHPLKRYSLRGSSQDLERLAVAQVPLLDELCFAGQLTVWYGPPNAGKTLLALSLLIEAVEQGRVDPENVLYVNVDDSTVGLAAKVGILEQLNVHVLGEGHRDFTAGKLVKQLQDTIAQNKSRGVFLILDTMKKFASLMDKKESSTFNTLCRQFAAAGGTILALAHTNKRTAANGELIPAGTTDVREDFDAAYILTPREEDSTSEKRIVEFKNIKMRGANADRVLFSYDCKPDTAYDERLASVTRLDASGFAPILMSAEEREQDVVAMIAARIQWKPVQKMELALAVSKAVGVGRNSVIRVIDRYTGNDPEKHRWAYDVKERGAKVFRMLSAPTDPDPAASQVSGSMPSPDRETSAAATDPGPVASNSAVA